MTETSYNITLLNSIKAELDKEFERIKPDLIELSDYFMPRQPRFLTKEKAKVRKSFKEIKDAVVLTCVRNFGAGMVTSCTNPATNWLYSKIKNYDLSFDDEVREWCDVVTEAENSVLSGSNFYENIPLVYQQTGVFGFSNLYIEYDSENYINTRVIPVGAYRYSKNYKGEVDTVIRTYSETARNIVKQFGIDNVSEQIKNDIENKHYNNVYEIIHYVGPNEDFMPDAIWAKNKKYVSIYYLSTAKDKEFLSVSGYDYMPYVIFECECNDTDVYPSVCPGINSLPDVKQLMKMVVDLAKGLKKMVSPTTQGSTNLKKGADIDKPNVYVQTDDKTGAGIKTIYDVNPQILNAYQVVNQLKESIKESWLNDIFTIIMQTAGSQRTAYEVSELKEEKLSLLAPTLNQFQRGLKQVHDIIFSILQNYELIPQAPEQVLGAEVVPEFETSLTLARKAVKVGSIERTSTFIANIANAFGPAVMKKFDALSAIDEYVQLSNTSAKFIRDNDEAIKMYQQEVEQAQQQQQQQQLMNALEQGSKIYQNMGGADAFGGELADRLGQ